MTDIATTLHGAADIPRVQVEYCGEWFTPDPARVFTVGRGGDLDVDDNPYLHRRFLEISHDGAFWRLANVGDRVAATVVDTDARFSAHLRSGGVLPLVLPSLSVRFSAGPTTYEFAVHVENAPYAAARTSTDHLEGTRTRGDVVLTPDQRLCLLALAESALQRPGSGASHLPPSREAAERLGWSLTKFNRKLDNLCHKLSQAGVKGLHGGAAQLASNRRARLVEYGIASGLVTVDDLPLLTESTGTR